MAEQDGRGADAALGELGQVDGGGGAVAGDGNGRAVGGGGKAPCPAQRLGQGHGDVVEGLQAGGADLAIKVDAAAAVRLDAHGNLGVFEVLGQALGEQVAGVVFGHARQLERAHIRELHQALGADVVAVAHG